MLCVIIPRCGVSESIHLGMDLSSFKIQLPCPLLMLQHLPSVNDQAFK